MRHTLEKKFRAYLESDMEPQHLILNRLRGIVHNLRAFERNISGVEPVSVIVECSELANNVAALSVGRDAITQFYQSPLFINNGFELVRDRQGAPQHIVHKNL